MTIDDHPNLSYRYWAFHLVYACASMYLMMTMTNWYDPAESLEESFQKGDQAGFYIQAVTTLVILLIYLIALVAPVFCPNSRLSDQLEGNMGIADRPSNTKIHQSPPTEAPVTQINETSKNDEL